MQTFMECGWAAWVILLLTIIAVAGALVAVGLAFFKPKWGLPFAVVAFGLTLCVPAAGVIGTSYGKSVVDGAVSGHSIDPAQRERIRKVGYEEAGTCTGLGLGFGALPGLLSILGLGIAIARRKGREPG